MMQLPAMREAGQNEELSAADLATSTRSVIDDPQNQDNRQLFFAKVLRSATEEEVRLLFGQFGKVTDVNLFRAFQGAPTTKGCGLVTMGTHDEAVAAISTLDSQYVWDGMETPMVVKWMDTALQRRRREQHLANLRQAMAPGVGLNFMPGSLALATSLPVANFGLYQNSFLDALEPAETPPPGCAPDAIKLFVGNVPKSCTEEQLLPLFQSVGKVVELVIVHDKVTHESKGSAFVWYATRADAESAILQFNFRHVLPDPSGDQDRPLVVRRAKARAKPLKHSPLLGTALGQAAPPPMMTPGQPFLRAMPRGLPVGLQGFENLSLNDAAQFSQLAQAGGAMGLGLGGMHPFQAMSALGGQLVGMQPPPPPSLYDAYSGGDRLLGNLSMGSTMHGNVDAAAVAQLDALGAPHEPQQPAQHVALSMTLNQAQLTALNIHLFSIQTVSGAQLHISPGAPGLFTLLVTGSKSQVETAKGLVTTVLSHS